MRGADRRAWTELRRFRLNGQRVVAMEWERIQQQLLRADQLVAQAERCLVAAREAVHGARTGDTCNIDAEQALKTLEIMLEEGIAKRDRLRDRLRLLTN